MNFDNAQLDPAAMLEALQGFFLAQPYLDDILKMHQELHPELSELDAGELIGDWFCANNESIGESPGDWLLAGKDPDTFMTMAMKWLYDNK